MKIKDYLCPCMLLGRYFYLHFQGGNGCNRAAFFIAKLSIITPFLYYKDTNFICICKEKCTFFSIKILLFFVRN